MKRDDPGGEGGVGPRLLIVFRYHGQFLPSNIEPLTRREK